MSPLLIVDLQRVVGDLMINLLPWMLVMSRSMVGSFAVMIIAYAGWNIAKGHGATDELQRAIVLIAVATAMVTYYDRPMPGIGYSFTQILRDPFLEIGSRIERDGVQHFASRLSGIQARFFQPNPWNTVGNIVYVLLYAVLSLASSAAIAVTMVSVIGVAVSFVVGPFFIPFLVIKPLDFFFWGWLKVTLGFSMVPMVLAAFLFVGLRWIDLVTRRMPPYVETKDFMVYAFQIGIAVGVFGYFIFKVPSLAASYISGHAPHGHSGMLAMLRFKR